VLKRLVVARLSRAESLRFFVFLLILWLFTVRGKAALTPLSEEGQVRVKPPMLSASGRAFCLCMLAHGLVRTAQWLLAARLVSGHSHSLAATARVAEQVALTEVRQD